MEHPERDALDLEEQLVEERPEEMDGERCGKRQRKTMKDGKAGVKRRCQAWRREEFK